MSNVTVIVTMSTGAKFLHSYNGCKPAFMQSLERHLKTNDDLHRAVRDVERGK